MPSTPSVERRLEQIQTCLQGMKSYVFAAAIALTTVAVSADAGTIHPGLRTELNRLAPNETVGAILMLEEQVAIEDLSASLTARRATRQERHREVVLALQETAARTQGPLLVRLEELIQTGEIKGYRSRWIANLVVVSGTRSAIEELANRADVAVAEYNFKPELISPVGGIDMTQGDEGRGGETIEPGLLAINADRVWNELGITGEGALQGGCDTGVDGNHPALSDRWRGLHAPASECWLDVLSGGTDFPTDNGGHGTHVMGTQAGKSPSGDTIGVAWGSEWIATNPINQGVGNEFDNDIITCYEWFADPDGNPNTVVDVPDCVQNSWRINENFGGNYEDCDTRWWAAIDNLEAGGTVLIFSAGNEGSGSQTIGSPADRATSPLNAFSIGAVNGNGNFPYPIASFSSRGPSGCSGNAVKPEVSAPGVDVRSSFPGGSYGFLSGTSMSGPHVTGVVALMRSADPNIEVDAIKQILIDTSVDHGATGEDNNYGWGVIDAYDAVLAVATGLGSISGTVTNASDGNVPLPGVTVTLVEADREFTSTPDGSYSGFAPYGTYTAEATHPSFATQQVSGVVIDDGPVEIVDFALVDNAPPVVAEVSYPPFQGETLPVTAYVEDFSSLSSVSIEYRVDGGGWLSAPMNPVAFAAEGYFNGDIPPQQTGALVEFYVLAEDVAGNQGTEPSNAPIGLFSIVIAELVYSDDAESDNGWSLSESGDAAAGRWVRTDPYGTQWQGNQVEPGDDHTDPPGVVCFVTGIGSQGGSAGQSDVDGGCVTLTTPQIDLSDAIEAELFYWRWYAQFGPSDASFTVQASSNNGASWTEIEMLDENANDWTRVQVDLDDAIDLTGQVKIRFIACDDGSDTLLEAAIDDLVIGGVLQNPVDVDPSTTALRTQLLPNRPNPFNGGTVVRFSLAEAADVSISIFDASGRLVRKLVDETVSAGHHGIDWDGKDDSGRNAPAGIYLYQLETEGFSAQRKMIRMQ